MPDFIAVLKTTRLALAFMFGTTLAVQTASLSAQPVQRDNQPDLLPETLASDLPNINDSSERWYQVEITLFLHTYYDPEEETWKDVESLTASSAGSTRLLSLNELLALPEWSENTEALETMNTDAAGRASPVRNTRSARSAPVSESGVQPEPLIDGPEVAHQSDFRVPDLTTDGFVMLLPEDWQFSGSNAALERSPNYRVLYHAAWRQPMRLANATQDIVIEGGRKVDDRYELEGTLRLHFNSRRDRIILDNQLVLNVWGTPNAAGSARPGSPQIVQSIPVSTTRELRSNEFHYLDHPVVGALVEVFPYELETSE